MEFTLTTTFPTSPSEIYKAWLSSDGHSKMTGSTAIASEKEGEDFTAWEGYITGKNIALRPHSNIKQTWRTSEFKDTDPDSQIEIQIRGNKKESTLILIHTDVPENGEQYKKGWEEHYFQPMKKYFLSK
jgi:activator of HSP90 ATPase